MTQPLEPPPFESVLEKPLLRWSDPTLEPWKVRDAYEGLFVLGSIGSGKTSGSGATFAQAFLRNGFGGVVLCAKADEIQNWQRWARDMGRGADLIEFSPNAGTTFNFLDYEANRKGLGGGITENIVSLLMTAVEIAHRNRHEQGDFWAKTARTLLRNSIELIRNANRSITLGDIHTIVNSAPKSPHVFADENSPWHDQLCAQLLTQAKGKEGDIKLAYDYFTEEFPYLADTTRSSVVLTLKTTLDDLLRDPLRTLFSTTTNVSPDDVLAGKIVIVNLPTVGNFKQIGQFANVLWKYCVQQALESRPLNTENLPVFIWADECQYFITEQDVNFQSTVRTLSGAMVYLTQNRSNLLKELGGEKSKSMVDSLLGNFSTKIFHSNDDTATNTWASESIGDTKQILYSQTTTTSSGGGVSRDNLGRKTGYSRSDSHGESKTGTEHFLREIQPNEFKQLRSGGPANGKWVTAIMTQRGRVHADEKLWQRIHLHQESPNATIQVDSSWTPPPPPLPWKWILIVGGGLFLVLVIFISISSSIEESNRKKLVQQRAAERQRIEEQQRQQEAAAAAEQERQRQAIEAERRRIATDPEYRRQIEERKRQEEEARRQAEETRRWNDPTALLAEWKQLQATFRKYQATEKAIEPEKKQRAAAIESQLDKLSPGWRSSK